MSELGPAAGGKAEQGQEPPEEQREGVTQPQETLLLFAQIQEHFLGLLLHPALPPWVLGRQALIWVSQGQVGDGTEQSQWGW